MSAPAPSAFPYPHIDTDAQGALVVAGTKMKVVELVMAQRAHGVRRARTAPHSQPRFGQ